MSDLYKYENLTEKDKIILINELKEDANQVNSHIESFRRWVCSMPHLNCPTDSKFLLMFLRTAKFDHCVAQRRLDNFCTIRSSTRGSPIFFKYPKLKDSIIEKVLRTHQNIPIGKNAAGELVLLFKTNDWHPDEISVENMMQVIYMSFDLILAKESTQINGILSIFDLEGCSKKTLDIWSDPNLTKTVMRVWQDAFPIRMKGIVFYKAPTIFQIILKIIEFFITEKHRKRIHLIDNHEKLFNKIPGLKEIMPTEYGGNGGKLVDKVESWIKEVEQFYHKGDPWSSISVDETKRPHDTLLFLKHYEDYKGETMSGTEGSYVKYDNIY